MLFAVSLGLIGLLLIYFEFFVPGGILGAFGGLLLLASIVLVFWGQTHTYLGVVYVFSVIVLSVLTVRLALWKLKQRPSMYASEDQAGYVASKYDKHLIGKRGKALTDLKPSGHIEVDGERYQAISESSYIRKGASIEIISGEGARYKVRICA